MCGELGLTQIGERVTLCGWARKKRVLGALEVAFLPLADHTGFVQLSVEKGKWAEFLSEVRSEAVVKASGVVSARPERDQRGGSSDVEIIVEQIEILNNVVGRLPFSPGQKGASTLEEVNLKERPLYLRTAQMQERLRLRSDLAMAMREFLVSSHGFVEVETPTLFRRTPEGAREFIVPTRAPGKFYSLVQSPQQFKQLLMVGGLDRYFQIARCYRDEDIKSDRQPEFTQLDLEMSFVDENGVMGITEELVTSTLARTAPHLEIDAIPFPRMTYSEAMEKYGSDKPDTRKDSSSATKLNFLWVTDFPLFSRNEEGVLESTHHPFTAPVAEDEHLLFSGDEEKLEQIRARHYDLVVNGVEVGGGSIRVHNEKLQEHIFANVLKVSSGEFSHLLRNLGHGCPPHGGIALGFDRLLAVMCGVSSVREVIAFPKASTGKDLLTGAPTGVPYDALKEYGISVLK